MIKSYIQVVQLNPVMKPTVFLLLFLATGFSTIAQYQYDNKVFKTVYLEDLCRELKKNPDHILLDVRSRGEHEDTSQYKYLNIGHLKGAKHLDIRELPTRWRELLPYKDQPVYVYCSHSQRSRRASKLLTDSGFKNVININGGLTGMHMIEEQIDCARLLQANVPYEFISPGEFCKIAGNENIVLVDIRSDSIRKGISLLERQNAEGYIKGSIHIPLKNITGSVSSIPANKKVIIIDEYGNESPDAARQLINAGYKNVAILFNGMEGFAGLTDSEAPCKKNHLVHQIGYDVISPRALNELAQNPELVLLDLRSADEFNNKSKDAWRNIGNLRNAKNIPYATLKETLDGLAGMKSKPIVIYTFSGQPEAYDAAKKLAENGFTQVKVLEGGIFNLRWTAANIKNQGKLAEWVVNVPSP
jgi:rhodanese-related sulfurtransferase